MNQIFYNFPVTYPSNDYSSNSEVKMLEGNIEPINLSTEPYEMNINALGWSYHVIFGSQINGHFLCIPNWDIGCELAAYDDISWNLNSLLKENSKINYQGASAVLYALKYFKTYLH